MPCTQLTKVAISKSIRKGRPAFVEDYFGSQQDPNDVEDETRHCMICNTLWLFAAQLTLHSSCYKSSDLSYINAWRYSCWVMPKSQFLLVMSLTSVNPRETLIGWSKLLSNYLEISSHVSLRCSNNLSILNLSKVLDALGSRADELSNCWLILWRQILCSFVAWSILLEHVCDLSIESEQERSCKRPSELHHATCIPKIKLVTASKRKDRRSQELQSWSFKNTPILPVSSALWGA